MIPFFFLLFLTSFAAMNGHIQISDETSHSAKKDKNCTQITLAVQIPIFNLV